jgi:iron uptake system component EfeO
MPIRPFTVLVLTALALSLPFAAGGCGGEAGTSTGAARDKAALAVYRSYLEGNAADLNHWTAAMAAKVQDGAVTKAESRYAAARVSYGHLEPASKMFHQLDARIDRLGVNSAANFGGLHRLEKAFFAEATTDGVGVVARRLSGDVIELRRRLKTVELSPMRVIGGANEVLHELSVSTLAGEEERYSHVGLVDVAADLEGLEATFRAVEPVLAEADPDLKTEIEARFKASYAEVGKYGILARDREQARDREPGISFVIDDELSKQELGAIAGEIDALAELFSRLEDKLD